jgi:hypothetical protein
MGSDVPNSRKATKVTKGCRLGFGLAFDHPSFASLDSVRILLSLCSFRIVI